MRPKLAPGLWQYQRDWFIASRPEQARSLKSEKKCTDPWKDIETIQAELIKLGCQYAPMTEDKGRYYFKADCRLSKGGKGTSTMALSTHSSGAFSIAVKNNPSLAKASGLSAETLNAERIADCPQ